MASNKVDLMLDIETLGTRPGCVILSIAAVPFNVFSPLDYFYERVSSESCVGRGLSIDAKTAEWWLRQSAQARDEAFGGSLSIDIALVKLSDYITELGEVVVWGNGASFDAPILEAAYDVCNIKVPWKYTNARCFRTLKELFPAVPYRKPVFAHNALEDAKAQAAHAELLFRTYLKGV